MTFVQGIFKSGGTVGCHTVTTNEHAENNGHLQEYCSITHYNEAMRCWLPYCSNPRRRNENTGFHICCSKSHNKDALCSLVVRITELLSMSAVIRYCLIIAVPNIMIETIVVDLALTNTRNLSVLIYPLSQVRVI